MALLFVASSCSGDAGATESLGSESITTSSTTTTSTTLPTTTDAVPADFPEPEDGEVFDEYIAEQLQALYIEVRAAAENPTLSPELDYPKIAKLSEEPLRTATYEYLIAFAEEGSALREPAESAVGRTVDEKTRVSRVTETDGDTATVLECTVDDEDVVDASTGEVRITGVLTVLTTVTLRRFDDGWLPVSSEAIRTMRGVNGCFLASEAEFPY